MRRRLFAPDAIALANAVNRDLIRRKARGAARILFVDIYINKPGLAAITPTTLMYKSTTRKSLMPAEAWMAFAAIERGLRKI